MKEAYKMKLLEEAVRALLEDNERLNKEVAELKTDNQTIMEAVELLMKRRK